jgi:hypothetical protein
MNPSDWLRAVYMSEAIDNKVTLALAGAYFALARPDGTVRATVRELQNAACFGSAHTVLKYRDELIEAHFLDPGEGSIMHLRDPESVARDATQRCTGCNEEGGSLHGVQHSVARDATDDRPLHGVQHSVARGATDEPENGKRKKSPTPPKKENTSLTDVREVEEDAPATSPPKNESAPRSLQGIIEDEPTETFVDTIAEFFGLDVHFGQAANIWMNAETTQGTESKARRYIAQKFGELAGEDYASRTIERILRRDSDRYDGATEIEQRGGADDAPDRQADDSMTQHLEQKRSQSDGTINF